MILAQHLAHVVLVLRRHREACMLLARVQLKDGREAEARHLVKRARVVNRDVVSLKRCQDRVSAVELVGVDYASDSL